MLPEVACVWGVGGGGGLEALSREDLQVGFGKNSLLLI